MAKVFSNIQVDLDEELEEKLQWLDPHFANYRILKQSVDARRKNHPRFIYSVKTFSSDENIKPELIKLDKIKKYKEKPVLIVGSGPAGLFAALRLLERGIPCEIFEQGEPTHERIKSIARFWRYGELKAHSNIGFGEGGAGLFSDGKLITRIKSEYIPYVMQRLVQLGAPEEIEYLANPHVGSDKIRRIIPKLRERIEFLGGKIHFYSQVKDLLTEEGSVCGLKIKNLKDNTEYKIKSDKVILATGHSTHLFKHLQDVGVFMESKPYAVGFRIEHTQEKINKIQYGTAFNHPKLDAANYKLAYTNKEHGVGVYSFCMCPGGYVLNASTDQGFIVSNGMSNYNRNSSFANSALVVAVDPGKDKDNIFSSLKFREDLEKRAFEMVKQAGGKRELPAQKLGDFLNSRFSKKLNKNSSLSGALSAPLHEILEPSLNKKIAEAFEVFNRRMKGFASEESLLFGVESRTSCPLKITRDKKSLESVSHKGLYPCGEGAGYAGGITSAACDGVKIADQIFRQV